MLLEVYNEMVKEAQDQEINARVELLGKYANVATELLQDEYPNDYTKEDVLELTDALIQKDINDTVEQEKQAEAQQLLTDYVTVADQLLAQEYGKNYTSAEVEKLASTMYELDAEQQFIKEADVLAEYVFLDEFNKIAETNFGSTEELLESLEKLGATPQFLTDSWNWMKNLASTVGKKTGYTNQLQNALGKGEVGQLRAHGAMGEAFMEGAGSGDRRTALLKQLKGIGIASSPLVAAGGGGYLMTRNKNNE